MEVIWILLVTSGLRSAIGLLVTRTCESHLNSFESYLWHPDSGLQYDYLWHVLVKVIWKLLVTSGLRSAIGWLVTSCDMYLWKSFSKTCNIRTQVWVCNGIIWKVLVTSGLRSAIGSLVTRTCENYLKVTDIRTQVCNRITCDILWHVLVEVIWILLVTSGLRSAMGLLVTRTCESHLKDTGIRTKVCDRIPCDTHLWKLFETYLCHLVTSGLRSATGLLVTRTCESHLKVTCDIRTQVRNRITWVSCDIRTEVRNRVTYDMYLWKSFWSYFRDPDSGLGLDYLWQVLVKVICKLLVTCGLRIAIGSLVTRTCESHLKVTCDIRTQVWDRITCDTYLSKSSEVTCDIRTQGSDRMTCELLCVKSASW